MLTFKKPEISDKKWVDSCLENAKSLNCEYTFGMQFIWADAYNTQICHYKDFFICRWENENNISYSVPLGSGDFKDAVNQIIEDAKSLGIVPAIYGVTKCYRDDLEELFPDMFTYKGDSSFDDYIYLVSKMESLSGKKLHAKRNHINNFKKNNPNWQFETINSSNIGECIELHKSWISEKDDENNEDYYDEFQAVLKAFENYDALDFLGGIIRVNGKAVAYTMGEPLKNKSCFVTHFEKAPTEIQGAFAIINQEFTKNCLGAYEYVNREEDLGLEGLRKAKESYYPEIKLEKYLAVYND